MYIVYPSILELLKCIEWIKIKLCFHEKEFPVTNLLYCVCKSPTSHVSEIYMIPTYHTYIIL